MDSCSKFLAENVITEGKVVTYRLLSRALRLHVNTAKQMLYEFHRIQNAKRPGVLHATYLVYGAKKATDEASHVRDGADDDVEMMSSPPEVGCPAEAVPTFTLSLVPEERLNEVLAEYEEVFSIHVYSIGPHPSKDLSLLADAANQALTLETNNRKSPVPITNPYVRRRERQGPGLKAAAAATSAVKSQARSAPSKTAQAPAPAKVKQETKAAKRTHDEPEKRAAAAPVKKPAPPLKRGSSSGIMQAFSKAATKAKKGADTSRSATPSGDDSNVQPMSDDGEDDVQMPEPKLPTAAELKRRKQREDELRRMMEDDDDDDDEEEASSEKADTPAEETMEEEPAAAEPAKEEETEIVTASTNGRRRGKRRVMRKKQIMDEQGYLVTIQEPGWESFSEDELPPPTKPKTTSSAPATQAAKPKKGGQKGGQGSIMSFFSKK